MDTVIGTCSICKGRVCVPSAWYGVKPPTPTCDGCGATPKQPHGQVIEMEPKTVTYDPNIKLCGTRYFMQGYNPFKLGDAS